MFKNLILAKGPETDLNSILTAGPGVEGGARGAGRGEKDMSGVCLEAVEKDLCRNLQGQDSFTGEETGHGQGVVCRISEVQQEFVDMFKGVVN